MGCRVERLPSMAAEPLTLLCLPLLLLWLLLIIPCKHTCHAYTLTRRIIHAVALLMMMSGRRAAVVSFLPSLVGTAALHPRNSK